MALDSVLLEGLGRDADWVSPPTVRLMSFSPPAVLVGAYQSVANEVRVEYCRAQGIEISRRVTGGGAILFDRSQIGWEVACRFEDLRGPARPNEELFRTLSQPVVSALRELGLPASYRPRNDIEIEGRKISGTGGTDLRGALLFQGTLLVDFDVETMIRALRVPVEKLRRQELDGMRERVTWLSRELGTMPEPARIRELLARHFEGELGIELRRSELTAAEQGALRERLERYESDEWVFGRRRVEGEMGKAIFPTDGGVLRIRLKTESGARRVRTVMIDGDFFAFPRRAVLDLEASLKGVRVAKLPEMVVRFFAENQIEIPGVGAEGVIAALSEAAGRAGVTKLGMGSAQLNAIYPVGRSLEEVAAREPTHLLLPYCAKPISCEWRGEDGCDGCGDCTVGEAYSAGREAGLEVRSITSFEHLMDTLSELHAGGAPAYLGSCCEAFYVKHRRDMEGAELPGLLFDVANDETCYDLGKSAYAYRGEFEGESSLDLELLAALIRACRRGTDRT